MRRTLLALSLVLCALAVPAAAQTAAPPLTAKASLAACQTGGLEDQRFAVFTGGMEAVRGTERMAMRFDLLVREAGDVWRTVRAKGFGRWERSLYGKSRFVWTKRVERLLQGAQYRVVVRFRWYQAGGVRRDRVRRSPVCRQPDQRPDLEVDAVDVQPGSDAGSRRYVFTIVNDGEGAAGAFGLTASLGDEPLGEREIAGLPPGERATVELVGQACPAGSELVVRVDPGRVVDESDEGDNRFVRPC